MKSLVVYYSHSGNTASVAHKLWSALSQRGDAEIIRLEYSRGVNNPAMRLLYRIIPALTPLWETVSDLKNYDVIGFGIPVLAGHPSAAIIKYINMCEYAGNKKIVCCYVYSVEISAKQCVRHVERILKKNRQTTTAKLFIHWTKVRDEQFVNKAIDEALAKLA
ncbi:MAG: hypothetical protein Q8O30_01945 [Candidatus Omnitrophota bacterium]|nr:hypothetical protein [Candidatus Omnitrophota bacterium]